jgi:hypothetical protein
MTFLGLPRFGMVRVRRQASQYQSDPSTHQLQPMMSRLLQGRLTSSDVMPMHAGSNANWLPQFVHSVCSNETDCRHDGHWNSLMRQP